MYPFSPQTALPAERASRLANRVLPDPFQKDVPVLLFAQHAWKTGTLRLRDKPSSSRNPACLSPASVEFLSPASLGDQVCPDLKEPPECLAARFEIAKLVEAGASRAEQHRVTRLGVIRRP